MMIGVSLLILLEPALFKKRLISSFELLSSKSSLKEFIWNAKVLMGRVDFLTSLLCLYLVSSALSSSSVSWKSLNCTFSFFLFFTGSSSAIAPSSVIFSSSSPTIVSSSSSVLLGSALFG